MKKDPQQKSSSKSTNHTVTYLIFKSSIVKVRLELVYNWRQILSYKIKIILCQSATKKHFHPAKDLKKLLKKI